VTADADDLRAMARSWAWVEEDRDRRTRPKYVPTGGFTRATENNELYLSWPGRSPGYTGRVLDSKGLPYGMAPARTPIYANRPWEDALLPPLDEMSLLDE